MISLQAQFLFEEEHTFLGLLIEVLTRFSLRFFCFRVKNNGTSYFIVFEKEAYLVSSMYVVVINLHETFDLVSNTASLSMDRKKMV